jgi:hypothetical protein
MLSKQLTVSERHCAVLVNPDLGTAGSSSVLSHDMQVHAGCVAHG